MGHPLNPMLVLAAVPLMAFMRATVTPFLLWSSVVCLLVGLCQAWPRLTGASA